jgi:hypothetical protein
VIGGGGDWFSGGYGEIEGGVGGDDGGEGVVASVMSVALTGAEATAKAATAAEGMAMALVEAVVASVAGDGASCASGDETGVARAARVESTAAVTRAEEVRAKVAAMSLVAVAEAAVAA